MGKNGTSDSNGNLEQGKPELSNNQNKNNDNNSGNQGNNQPVDTWDDNDMYLNPEKYSDQDTQTQLTEQNTDGMWKRAFAWKQDDARGFGQWMGDSTKNLGKELRKQICRNKSWTKNN